MHHLILFAWALLTTAPTVAGTPKPPVWPDRFIANMFQNRSGQLAQTTLIYDWPGGRNLNVIWKQQGSILFDLEWTNGTSYYFDRKAETCKTIKFPVGILRPDWLDNATYLGTETVDTKECHKWEKADFITYWASLETGNPIRWRFFTGAQFEILSFLPDALPPEDVWQAPSYCFDKQPSVS